MCGSLSNHLFEMLKRSQGNFDKFPDRVLIDGGKRPWKDVWIAMDRLSQHGCITKATTKQRCSTAH